MIENIKRLISTTAAVGKKPAFAPVIDAEMIKEFAPLTSSMVDKLLGSLITDGLLVAVAKDELEEKGAKKVATQYECLTVRIKDFGCDPEEDVLFANPDTVESACGSNTYQNLVYKSNFAVLAYQLFEIARSKSYDEKLSLSKNLRDYFPDAFGLKHDLVSARFIVLMSVQEFIHLTLKEPGKHAKDLELRFMNLLEGYPIESSGEVEVVDKVKETIAATKSSDRDKLIETLKEKFPVVDFYVAISDWIEATVKAIDETAAGAAFATTIASALTGASDVSVEWADQDAKSEAQVASGENFEVNIPVASESHISKKRRFNEPQPDREKLPFDSQQEDNPAPPPKRSRTKRNISVRNQPPIPAEALFLGDSGDTEASKDDQSTEGADLSEIAQASADVVTATPVRTAASSSGVAMTPTAAALINAQPPSPSANRSPSVAARRPPAPQGHRKKWNPDMEEALLCALRLFDTRWSDIEFAVYGLINNDEFVDSRALEYPELKRLHGRTAAMLKDKARNMKHKCLLKGLPVPPELAAVTVSKNVVEKARASAEPVLPGHEAS